jgi:hypothetical protein
VEWNLTTGEERELEHPKNTSFSKVRSSVENILEDVERQYLYVLLERGRSRVHESYASFLIFDIASGKIIYQDEFSGSITHNHIVYENDKVGICYSENKPTMFTKTYFLKPKTAELKKVK